MMTVLSHDDGLFILQVSEHDNIAFASNEWRWRWDTKLEAYVTTRFDAVGSFLKYADRSMRAHLDILRGIGEENINKVIVKVDANV